MSSSKKLTCKGTLRQVFIKVYRLEIQSVMLVFLTLSPSLWFNSPPPLPCVKKYSTAYTYTVCNGGAGGYGILGLRQINTCRKVLFQINFLDDDILHCLL